MGIIKPSYKVNRASSIYVIKQNKEINTYEYLI